MLNLKVSIYYNHNSIDCYNFYMQTYDHLKQKLEILRDTQVMLTKEIWRKKQLLKIMYTNKSFIKKSSRNVGNTFDGGYYSYSKGISYTEEMEPKEDFLYERRKSNANNSSFNCSQRGVSITQAMKNKTIQEEAKEIEDLKVDVDNIEEKINIESQWLELYYSKYEESKLAYEDKKAVIEDFNMFKNCLEQQKESLKISFLDRKSAILDELTDKMFSSLYNEGE